MFAVPRQFLLCACINKNKKKNNNNYHALNADCEWSTGVIPMKKVQLSSHFTDKDMNVQVGLGHTLPRAAVLCEGGSYMLQRNDRVHLSLTPCSMMSCWQLRVYHCQRICATGIDKCCILCVFCMSSPSPQRAACKHLLTPHRIGFKPR